jgi:ABC-2 type transport system ATP-binding protein
MYIFEALNIDKSYAEFKALDNVSVHFPEGNIYGLLGPNGAGKTTLLRIINRITAPDQGELLFRGKRFTREDLIHIGYLPEERGLYKKMKVGEQALYLAQLKGLSKSYAMSQLKTWFGKFEMTNWWNKKIEELSKGMAQKVQFIITVLHNPSLLIFDEPFSGFDPVNAGMLKKEVLELKQKGTTIIFSTHDMASVEELCDHITLIDKSRTILEGSVSNIKQQYKANIFEIDFEGDPEKLQGNLNGNFTLSEINTFAEGKYTATIQLPDTKKGNDLLTQAVKYVSVLSFREVLPSMNDIFIRAVNKNSKKTDHE